MKKRIEDYTVWSIFKDLTNQYVYWCDYNNLKLCHIQCRQIFAKVKQSKQVYSIPLTTDEENWYIDETEKVKAYYYVIVDG
ncbi:MAG: hypothetical protein AAGG51_19820 [Cyanobacteria bacterium P01_G01_bin.54]